MIFMRDSKYKKEFLLVFSVLLIIVAVVAFFFFAQDEASNNSDHRNTTYSIDGQPITLVDGFAEVEAAPDSASKITTRYFGNELVVDLNNDSREDIIFLLTQETGGSGTFYYVVAALNTEDGYVGSEGYLLGDRIAPQTTELSQNPKHQNVIVVNYADRTSGEPMSADPSVGKSVWLKLNPETMQFGVVEQNFEGEANPSRMSLTMDDWTWVSALYNDGRSVEPNTVGDFVLTFGSDGTFSAKTDCNSMSGGYTVGNGSLAFDQIAMTKMFCADSQETEFLKILEGTAGYHFTPRGELILDLKFDSGTATFQVLNTSQPAQQHTGSAEPYRASLSGEYVCLPHRDVGQEHTLECAFGIKTDTGEYYGIDFYLMSQTHDPVEIGQRISANGVVQPAERLSSSHWQKYPIVGIFSVTDALQILE